MLYLIIAIVSMSAFMLGLKFLNVKGIPVPQAIMTNYVFALAVAVISGWENLSIESIGGIFSHNWWWMGVVAGVFYFASMDIMSASTRRAGVSITTIASRCALILPILWSALFFGESVTTWQWVGIALVMAAFVLIFYARRQPVTDAAAKKNNAATIIMPLTVFVIMGIVSVNMKSAQHAIQQSGNYATDYPVFNILIFATALAGSVIYYAVSFGRKAFVFNWKSILGGLCLGAFNYLVTFGIMNGLRFIPTSVFYALYNICVVIITTLAGVIAFREKLSPLKITGICLAAAAIAILSLLG